MLFNRDTARRHTTGTEILNTRKLWPLHGQLTLERAILTESARVEFQELYVLYVLSVHWYTDQLSGREKVTVGWTRWRHFGVHGHVTRSSFDVLLDYLKTRSYTRRRSATTARNSENLTSSLDFRLTSEDDHVGHFTRWSIKWHRPRRQVEKPSDATRKLTKHRHGHPKRKHLPHQLCANVSQRRQIVLIYVDSSWNR